MLRQFRLQGKRKGKAESDSLAIKKPGLKAREPPWSPEELPANLTAPATRRESSRVKPAPPSSKVKRATQAGLLPGVRPGRTTGSRSLRPPPVRAALVRGKKPCPEAAAGLLPPRPGEPGVKQGQTVKLHPGELTD